jgi:hypothetical protein
MRGGQRQPAVPAVLFQGRISVDADKVRRKLQDKLDLSASKLIELALQALDRELNMSREGKAGMPPA